MDAVIGVVETRSTLPSLIEQITSEKLARVVIGSHRKPQVMLVPFAETDRPEARRPLLDFARERADLIARIAASSNITSVAVFGSAARFEEHADSDLDLLVTTSPDASLFDLAQFEGDMELLFSRPVDVLDRAALDPERDRSILVGSIAL